MSHMIDLALGAFPSMVNMICDLTGWIAVSGSEKNVAVAEDTAYQGSPAEKRLGKPSCRETLEILTR